MTMNVTYSADVPFTAQEEIHGSVIRISGPVVVASGLVGVRMYDVVYVGRMQLLGEVIRLATDLVTIQVYEDTSGLAVGEPVVSSGAPFMVELGPGLLEAIFDGIQRPLPILQAQQGDFIRRGGTALALDRTWRWIFTPTVAIGDEVQTGDVLGTVQETAHLEHRIIVPHGAQGVVEAVESGEHSIDETVVILRNGQRRHELTLMQRWPARQPRPYQRKLDPTVPLITGQRVVDAFFPIPKGGTAIVPGGFGTGKTVMEQTFAKWADADIVVFIGCGERGNEMTEVLEEFPKLEDPRHGAPLMERTVLIANTSNMPVAAREASIYTGITIAEYFRDMGYDVALFADSTSRWGEALREVSGRLEEMPGEEGYPAYLLSRLAEFYERGGRVTCLGREDRVGSMTLIGAVSPPGGDFSEPMTQNSLRVTGAFWGLDTDLARRRHFPAINWTNSYSRYKLEDWFDQQVAVDWSAFAQRARALLQRETELQEIVQLVGADALAEHEKAELAIGRILREDFLQQSAFSDDAFSPLPKTYWMLKVILIFYEHVAAALADAIPLSQILQPAILDQIGRIKEWNADDAAARADALLTEMERVFNVVQSGRDR